MLEERSEALICTTSFLFSLQHSSQKIKDEKGNILNPRFERSKSILVAKASDKPIELTENVINSVETPMSSILKMVVLAKQLEEETRLKQEEKRRQEERRRLERERLKELEARNESLRRAAEASGMLPTGMLGNVGRGFNRMQSSVRK